MKNKPQTRYYRRANSVREFGENKSFNLACLTRDDADRAAATLNAQQEQIAEFVEAIDDGLFETEYDGRMGEVCFFCYENQQSGKAPIHAESCIVAKHAGKKV